MISPVTDRRIHQDIILGGHATEGKPQFRKVGAQISCTGKRNGQIFPTHMGTASNNLFHPSHQL